MDQGKVVDSLRQQGHKLTKPRLAVMNVLFGSEGFLGALDVHRKLVEQGHDVGLTSVYRALDLLTELGILVREEFGPNGERYRLATDLHSHTVVCTGCGKTAEFSGCQINELVDRVERDTHFAIRDHWLRLFGVCTDCQGQGEVRLYEHC